ncbi:proteasome subunit beta [Candidatus Woesearchaeota archaeon]|nr:proteasome subunit beta [Candidatus Woesearchaeota archaeon]|tara:strand:- start:4258 stop:4899 length:642 start_codon:yes stop_codon:yes gene_type:complete
MKEEEQLKTGTTTVGIVGKDCIILAADKRATAGFLIADKKSEKIYKITDNIAVTMAGTVSDAQLLLKYAESELRLKKIRTGLDCSVKEAANLLARFVYYNIRKMSMIPGIAHFVLGGKDSTGFYLYDIYADGSITLIDDYISSGSGSVMAYGVLETLFRKDTSLDEGVKLAVKCVNAAIQRDAASGNGLDVVSITSEGAKKIVEKQLDTTIKV